MSFVTEFETRVQAAYPVLYITAREDWRCVKEVEKIAKKMKISTGAPVVFLGWTASTGKPSDPLELMRALERANGTVACLVNFHFYLNDPVMIQVVKDVTQSAKMRETTVVFVSNKTQVPDELKSDLSFMEFELPDRALLAERLAFIRDSNEITDKLDQAAITEAALGMTTWEAENAMALSLVEAGTIDPKIIAREKAKAVSKGGILEFYEPISGGMGSVGGLGNLKEWLVRRKRAFSDEAKAFGLPSPKGILLVGPPGTGKSLTAKAVSQEWGIPLVRLDMGKLFRGIVGSSEQAAREATSMAEAIAPTVMWIDEIEKGVAGMGSSGATDSGVTARVMGTFLSWMQDRQRPVFIVATANNVSNLPPEMLRAGRWDEVFYVDLPGEGERLDILKIHIQVRKRDPDLYDLKHIAGITSLFSGAELEAVVVKGLFRAFSLGRELENEDLSVAVLETVPLAVTRREDIAALREWAQSRAIPASKSPPPEMNVEVRKVRRFVMTVGEEGEPRTEE